MARRSRAFRTARGPWWSRDSVDWRVIAPSQVHVGRELRMENHAEAQAAIDAERHAGRLADVLWQGIELAGQDGGCVLA